MMNIPIDQIARYMETHKNQPVPLEYAEILMGELKQAHRAGWEQCQREAKDKAEAFAHAGKLCCMEKADKIKDAIASMEYKEAGKTV